MINEDFSIPFPSDKVMEKLSRYVDKLQDERWNKKRECKLKELEYKCQCCGSQRELTVRPQYYVPGRDPWEYPDRALVGICKECDDIVTNTEHISNQLAPWERMFFHREEKNS